MTDEKNDRDIEKMNAKREQAIKILHDFKKWYDLKDSTDNMLVYIGLHRDIMHGTEAEVDRLIERMEEKNQQALMQKLQQGVE